MIDFPLNLRDDKENWTWFKGSLWLSLDRFERFWPDVGLTLSNGEAVKSAVRGVLRVQYAIDAANRARWAADPDAPDELDETVSIEELAKTCFRTLAETAGTQDTECVARWLTGPVLTAYKEAPWHNTWRSLLYCMAEEDPSTLTSVYGIPGDTARKLVEIAMRFKSEVDGSEERVEAAEQEPLSGWDAVAYADYRNDDPGVNPLTDLWSLLQYLCFDRALAEVVHCTRPADINALIQWGNAFLRARNRPYDAIIPDDVRRAW
ncbi:MAG: hypothetical protein IPM54_09720 [Polyangiaceae bacterium]|nr:hypothetical protein [Polyangiaceae bacterium]